MKTTESGKEYETGFRPFLQRKFAERCLGNPKYSLRAFAQSMQIDHSTLSQLLRGKRRFTDDTIRKLGRKLNLAKHEIEIFVACERHSVSAEVCDRNAEQLRREAMEVISQWHHFAILELTHLDCFQTNCKWIARVLDISLDEVNVAITRLLHLGLLKMVDQNSWIDQTGNAITRFDQLPAGISRHVMDRLSRLSESNSASCGQLLSSSTFAVDRRRLAVVSRYLERVRQDITQLLAGEQSTCDDVFQLDIFLYPLTRLHQEHHSHGTTSYPIPDHRERSEQVR